MWHIAKFQPSQVVDHAIEIEKKGKELYQRLAEKATDDKIKNLLLHLADEEDKHQEKFRELGKDFKPVNAPETYEGEYLDYVGALVDSHLFKNDAGLEELVVKAESELDILRLATNFEKDTILFLNGLNMFMDKGKRSVIDDLIMEEQIHLVKLARIKKEVVGDGE